MTEGRPRVESLYTSTGPSRRSSSPRVRPTSDGRTYVSCEPPLCIWHRICPLEGSGGRRGRRPTLGFKASRHKHGRAVLCVAPARHLCSSEDVAKWNRRESQATCRPRNEFQLANRGYRNGDFEGDESGGGESRQTVIRPSAHARADCSGLDMEINAPTSGTPQPSEASSHSRTV